MTESDRLESHFSSAEFDMGGEQTESSQGGDSHTSSNKNEKNQQLAHRETGFVFWSRTVLFLVLFASTVTVSITTYFITHKLEISDFEISFTDQASRLVYGFEQTSKSRVQTINALAIEFTSHAMSVSNTTFPFITLPDFELKGDALGRQAQVMSTMFVPIVTAEQREAWEEYSVAHQGWYKEGFEIQQQREREQSEQDDNTTPQQRRRELQIEQDDPLAIPKFIYKVDGLGPGPERGPGPYLPIWQLAPVIPIPSMINFNLLSHPGYAPSIQALLEAQIDIMGRSFDFADDNDEATAGRRVAFEEFLQPWKNRTDDGLAYAEYLNDPVADLHIPLFDTFDQTTRKLVGLITCVIYWRTYFENVLPGTENGIFVILENDCGQNYTYLVRGPEVEFLGAGDLHDEGYDEMEFDNPNNKGGGEETRRNIEGSCQYSIRVYPSVELEAQFVTNRPITYAVGSIVIFALTSAIFIIYDALVERRQKVVLASAEESNAVVKTLFPEKVRERLYDTQKQQRGGSTMVPPSRQNKSDPSSTGGTTPQASDHPKNASDQIIADSFENCTILFADVNGFSSWAVDRDPVQIFMLLETVYGCFDKVANKRGVFKVETIGETYLAACGLPDPQRDHALRMTEFANEAQIRVTRLLQDPDIVTTLDTGCLSVRFGLHSGPVTAGVLRGAKTRFQLFGDTVNTAARMQTNSHGGRIHMSQTTADILTCSGKGHWIEPREDKVYAKGKGYMDTFWLINNRRKGDGLSVDSDKRSFDE